MRYLLVTLLFLNLATVAAEAGQAGYVLSVDGDWKWTTNGSAKVGVGDPVAENTTARATVKTAKLTIALLDGSVKSFNCPPLNPCVATIGPLQKPPDSLYSRLLAVGKTFFEQRDAVPVYAMSRGAVSAEFQPAVLALTEQGTDMTAAIKRLDPGIYELRLRALQGPAMTYSSKITWDPPAPAAATVANLRPGVFEATWTSEEGKRLGSAPVVVATPDQAPAQRASLEAGMTIVRGWPAGTDPVAVHNFLTALLLDIGRQTPVQGK